MNNQSYPMYRAELQNRQKCRYICIASPSHAVEIFETTDPHNIDPLGFEFKVLRSRPKVRRCETEGSEISREEWFMGAMEMMLTHLGSIHDLIQICDMRRTDANRSSSKKVPDYSKVIELLQMTKGSRRNIVRNKIQRDPTILLS